MMIRYKVLVLLLLVIPAVFICPVELCFIVGKNLIEVFCIYAEDEDPAEAVKKIYLLVFSVATVKISADLFYYYFGLDLHSLIDEGLLTKEDLERPNTELRKYVVDIRRAQFKKIGGYPEFFFENFIRFMSWDDDMLIRQMIEDYEKKERK